MGVWWTQFQCMYARVYHIGYLVKYYLYSCFIDDMPFSDFTVLYFEYKCYSSKTNTGPSLCMLPCHCRILLQWFMDIDQINGLMAFLANVMENNRVRYILMWLCMGVSCSNIFNCDKQLYLYRRFCLPVCPSVCLSVFVAVAFLFSIILLSSYLHETYTRHSTHTCGMYVFKSKVKISKKRVVQIFWRILSLAPCLFDGFASYLA